MAFGTPMHASGRTFAPARAYSSPTSACCRDDATCPACPGRARRLHHLVLFGSQARGDAHDESDVGVLGDELVEAVEMQRLTRIQVDVLNHHEQLLSLIPLSLSAYRDPLHPLMMNVQAEGVVL